MNKNVDYAIYFLYKLLFICQHGLVSRATPSLHFFKIQTHLNINNNKITIKLLLHSHIKYNT